MGRERKILLVLERRFRLHLTRRVVYDLYIEGNRACLGVLCTLQHAAETVVRKLSDPEEAIANVLANLANNTLPSRSSLIALTNLHQLVFNPPHLYKDPLYFIYMLFFAIN